MTNHRNRRHNINNLSSRQPTPAAHRHHKRYNNNNQHQDDHTHGMNQQRLRANPRLFTDSQDYLTQQAHHLHSKSYTPHRTNTRIRGGSIKRTRGLNRLALQPNLDHPTHRQNILLLRTPQITHTTYPQRILAPRVSTIRNHSANHLRGEGARQLINMRRERPKVQQQHTIRHLTPINMPLNHNNQLAARSDITSITATIQVPRHHRHKKPNSSHRNPLNLRQPKHQSHLRVQRMLIIGPRVNSSPRPAARIKGHRYSTTG